MDFPKHTDTIGIGLPILYFKGLQVKVSILWCTSIIVSNSADPDVIWVFIVCSSRGFQYIKGLYGYAFMGWANQVNSDHILLHINPFPHEYTC